MTVPEQMNFIETLKQGGPEVMRLNTGSVPQPRDDEVLIRVMAASVNYPDVLQRMGSYPLPHGVSPVIGLDVAGEVVATGRAVKSVNSGEMVCALTNGGG